MPRAILQTVSFKGVSPKQVYEALMDSKKHSRFTGAKARISRKTGGHFEAYDGYIEGTNLLLVPHKRIVQMWRGSDWPEGHYARTSFILRKTKTGTRLRFRQSNVPGAQFQPIKQGWIDFYWNPMREFFRNKNQSRGGK